VAATETIYLTFRAQLGLCPVSSPSISCATGKASSAQPEAKSAHSFLDDTIHLPEVSSHLMYVFVVIPERSGEICLREEQMTWSRVTDDKT
jgi:hypothetical protein